MMMYLFFNRLSVYSFSLQTSGIKKFEMVRCFSKNKKNLANRPLYS